MSQTYGEPRGRGRDGEGEAFWVEREEGFADGGRDMGLRGRPDHWYLEEGDSGNGISGREEWGRNKVQEDRGYKSSVEEFLTETIYGSGMVGSGWNGPGISEEAVRGGIGSGGVVRGDREGGRDDDVVVRGCLGVVGEGGEGGGTGGGGAAAAAAGGGGGREEGVGGGLSGGEGSGEGKARKRRSRWGPPESADSGMSGVEGGKNTEDGEKGNDEGTGGPGQKKRRSRWGPSEGDAAAGGPTSTAASILSGIKLPDFVKEIAGDLNPEVQALNIKLLEINKRLQTGNVIFPAMENGAEGQRSPSPEPVYDNMGIRINTREFRARERLTRERQEVIAELIKKNPNFKPPADYKPPKLYKKLYIPIKEYPGYNFIGLIIGPRGNTQKRMERETGAKIVIRGKGSVKEGRAAKGRDFKLDPADNEDLHVLVEADSEKSLEEAADMVQKLLVPVDEGRNEHKRAQLRELATLNGTIRDDEFCRLCGEPGHRQFNCPERNSSFRSDVLCAICGDGGHPTIDCPIKGTNPGAPKMDEEYQSFLAELGGGGPDSGGRSGDGSGGGGSGVGTGRSQHTGPMLGLPGPEGGSSGAGGMGGGGGRMHKVEDECNLYVGYLPASVDDAGLYGLFSPFGEIEEMKIIKDRATGMSKGYGFVKFVERDAAGAAIHAMNGYRLEGKSLVVRSTVRGGGAGGGPPLPPVGPLGQGHHMPPPHQGGPYHPHSHPQPHSHGPRGSAPLPPFGPSSQASHPPPPWAAPPPPMPPRPYPSPYGAPPYSYPPPPGSQFAPAPPLPPYSGDAPPAYPAPYGYPGEIPSQNPDATPAPATYPPPTVYSAPYPGGPYAPPPFPAGDSGGGGEVAPPGGGLSGTAPPWGESTLSARAQTPPPGETTEGGQPPAPPPPRTNAVESEYERFMSEMR